MLLNLYCYCLKKAAFISEGNSQINLLSILQEVPCADITWYGVFLTKPKYFLKDNTTYYALSLAINNSI